MHTPTMQNINDAITWLFRAGAAHAEGPIRGEYAARAAQLLLAPDGILTKLAAEQPDAVVAEVQARASQRAEAWGAELSGGLLPEDLLRRRWNEVARAPAEEQRARLLDVAAWLLVLHERAAAPRRAALFGAREGQLLSDANSLPTFALGEASALDHRVPARWTFDADVAARFDDMLRRSIPGLSALRTYASAIALDAWEHGSWILDLGCAKGAQIAACWEAFQLSTTEARPRFVGLDASPEMVAAARARLAGLPGCGVLVGDLVDWAEGGRIEGIGLDVDASVVLCLFTLQFLPVDARELVLRKVAALLRARGGGAFILAEKVGAEDAAGEMVRRLHRRFKLDRGYSPEAVDAKDRSLRGVLQALPAAYTERMLARTFDAHETFWTHLNFRAWVATVKAPNTMRAP